MFLDVTDFDTYMVAVHHSENLWINIMVTDVHSICNMDNLWNLLLKKEILEQGNSDMYLNTTKN